MAKQKKTDGQIDEIDLILSSKEFNGMHHGCRSGDEILAQDLITTSSFWFDRLLEGGFRSGSWSRFYGDPECGKTSMALCWGKNWQDKYPDDGVVIYFNCEGRINLNLINRSGINTEKGKFRIIDANNADFVYSFTDRLINSNPNEKRYFVIVDSTDAAERGQDKTKNLGEAEKIGGGATIVSAAGKRLSLLFSLGNHHLFLCSQVRDKVNTHGPGGGGKDASGGNAPRFYSSLTGHIQKPWTDTFIYEDPTDKKGERLGVICNIKMIKTPNEKTGLTVKIPIKYGLKGGVWRAYESYQVAEAGKFITQKGAWFEIENSVFEDLESHGIKCPQKFQGSKKVIDLFDSNPDIVEYFLKKGGELIDNLTSE